MPSRVRSQIEWDDARDRQVLRDLRRFRGRAIGRRIKELLLLGLEAERLGMRVVEQDGMPTVQGGLVPAVLQAVAPPSRVAEPVAGEPGDSSGELDAEHEAGLEDLLDGLGISFG